ncbi:unnamed protein product [Camellia sinensis]
MFRALSTRGGGGGGYERLVDESSGGLLEAKLNRVTSLPAKLFGSSSTKLTSEFNFPANFPRSKRRRLFTRGSDYSTGAAGGRKRRLSRK